MGVGWGRVKFWVISSKESLAFWPMEHIRWRLLHVCFALIPRNHPCVVSQTPTTLVEPELEPLTLLPHEIDEISGHPSVCCCC